MISSYKKVDFTTITLMLMKNLALINLNVKTKKNQLCAMGFFFLSFFYTQGANIFFFFFYFCIAVNLKLTTGWRLTFTHLLFTTNLIRSNQQKAPLPCKTPSPLKNRRPPDEPSGVL